MRGDIIRLFQLWSAREPPNHMETYHMERGIADHLNATVTKEHLRKDYQSHFHGGLDFKQQMLKILDKGYCFLDKGDSCFSWF